MKKTNGFKLSHSNRKTPSFPARKVFSGLIGALSLGVVATGCNVLFEEKVCEVEGARCDTASVTEICVENEEPRYVDCWDYCDDGSAPLLSAECNPDAENPCYCEYDILDGMVETCDPGDFMCTGDDSIKYCVTETEDFGYYDYRQCNDYCASVYGIGYISYQGCTDENTENPCNCEFEIIDGDMPICTPGDFLCPDEESVAICTESGYDYTYTDCDIKCVEDFGEGSVSGGCTTDDPTNPCNCD
ncbi:MAG: hypothetical protein JXR95_13075 [Deltaproteobacteria bacterium]|nr:hypothetical protein [Deltaproteobacteria bacterium]